MCNKHTAYLLYYSILIIYSIIIFRNTLQIWGDMGEIRLKINSGGRLNSKLQEKAPVEKKTKGKR